MAASKARLSSGTSIEFDDAVTKNDCGFGTDDGRPPIADLSPFKKGQIVFALHRGLIYKAKVIEVSYRSKQWWYFVHYPGWNKSWDEWVDVDHLRNFTEENVQKQLGRNLKQDSEKHTYPGCASLVRSRGSSVARGKKRKNESLNKEKGSIPLKKFVNLQIPPTLKKQLVDECESINHLGKHLKLPRSPNVEDILKKYEDYRSTKDGLVADSEGEVMKGLRSYFDKALPVVLLYESERQQYEYTLINNVAPSTIYGAEHLLRLFVKLPELLLKANIEEQTLIELQQYFVDFLRFLQKNQKAFFLHTYHEAEEAETSTSNLCDQSGQAIHGQ